MPANFQSAEILDDECAKLTHSIPQVPRARWMAGYFPVMVLIALAILIVLERLHTYREPLEPDLTTYAVIAHEMNFGKRLYANVWDIKPPGLYGTYALAEKLAGYGPQSVLLLAIGAALASLVAVYAA